MLLSYMNTVGLLTQWHCDILNKLWTRWSILLSVTQDLPSPGRAYFRDSYMSDSRGRDQGCIWTLQRGLPSLTLIWVPPSPGAQSTHSRDRGWAPPFPLSSTTPSPVKQPAPCGRLIILNPSHYGRSRYFFLNRINTYFKNEFVFPPHNTSVSTSLLDLLHAYSLSQYPTKYLFAPSPKCVTQK